jgi:DNA helicase II / ATP-dependent DNA helicase PcrA
MDLFDEIILPHDGTKSGEKAPLKEAGVDGQPAVHAASILRDMNPEQAKAVQHGDGPLLILAGAGSGKTRVITHRIAWLIQVRGVRPSAILAITFTNKAADEMKSRVETLIGPVSTGMWIGTFHAMMARILRRYADRAGYDRSFSIIDSDDQQKVVKDCLKELNLDEKVFLPKAVHGQISAAKNALVGVRDFARTAGADFRQSKVALVYERYQDKLKKSNRMDFDDLLFEAVLLFENNPDVLAEYQERFRYILVDEYQDTNHAQYRLVRLLSDKYRNLCVVGDDDQSIYSFRGANIQNILDFEKDFKGCQVIKLEQNYRSTGTVLKAANSVIGLNKGRKKKTLWTSSGDGEPITFLRAENHSEEGRYIAGEIDRLVGRTGRHAYCDIAILYRLNALSRTLEAALREQGIPYRIFGGMRFYDRKEIKDVMAWLRLIQIPGDDLSFTRAIQTPRRGIGETTLALLEAIAQREGQAQLAICAQAGRYPELARAAGKLQGFAQLVGRLHDRLHENNQSFPEYIEWVENESGLVQEIIDQQDSGREEAANRIENLKELLSDAVEFAGGLSRLSQDAAQLEPEDRDLLADDLPGILASFLERAALYSEMDEDRENRDYVRLLTIHSAKGLEFGVVFLVGAEEGLFPGYRAMGSEADIEEERRLAYVAMTRAKKKLYITTARSRLVFGQTQSMAVSRFVREIPDEYLEEIGGSREGEAAFGYRNQTERSRDIRTAAARFTGTEAGGSAAAVPAASGIPAYLGGSRGATQAAAAAGGVATAASNAIDWRKGDRVRHAKFGSGQIVQVDPVAGDAILLIEFATGERKRLMARMAKLEKI